MIDCFSYTLSVRKVECPINLSNSTLWRVLEFWSRSIWKLGLCMLAFAISTLDDSWNSQIASNKRPTKWLNLDFVHCFAASHVGRTVSLHLTSNQGESCNFCLPVIAKEAVVDSPFPTKWLPQRSLAMLPRCPAALPTLRMAALRRKFFLRRDVGSSAGGTMGSMGDCSKKDPGRKTQSTGFGWFVSWTNSSGYCRRER